MTDFSPFKFGRHINGLLLGRDETRIVATDSNLPAGERERVMAYELDHYALRHEGDIFSLPPNERVRLEREADVYAQRLLESLQRPLPEATLNPC